MTLEPALGLFLDGVIVVLLLSVIVAGFFLNRRIESLRRSAAGLERIVGGFDKATRRAQKGVDNLRTAANENGRELQERIAEARKLRDELAFLSSGTPERRTGPVRKMPASKRPTAKTAARRPVTPERSEMERELEQALRHVR